MKLKLPVDGDGFVRRRCPECSRDFKTRPADEDGAVCQAVVARGVPHANPDELSPYVPGPHCPYCGTVPPATENLTAAQKSWLERTAEYLGASVRYRELCAVPRPTFFVVSPDPPPARPLEPNDLHRVHFACCDEEAKVDHPGGHSLRCPRCGVVQQVGRPRANVSPVILEG